MKRMITFALACLMIVSLAACVAQQPQESTQPQYCDETFLEEFKAGLMARWDLTEEADSAENKNKSEREWRTELIHTELDRLEPYRTGLFQDPKLQERALAYMNLLQDQMDALDYINSDFEKYAEMWSEAYDKRTQMIADFIQDYNLEFPAAYTETVADMLSNAKVVTQKNEIDEKVQQMVDALQFDLVQNDYGLKTYRAVIENTTNVTFSDFMVDVSLINADGILVSTEYAMIENLSPGQKGYIEFMTTTDFTTYELKLSYYDIEQ